MKMLVAPAGPEEAPEVGRFAGRIAAGYDIVVLGRRRQEKIQEALLGSVSSKVVDALEDRDVRIAA